MPPAGQVRYLPSVPTTLSPRFRAVLAVQRRLSTAILESPILVAMLARSRSTPRDGRVLDPRTAAVLALDDLDRGSDLSGYPPVEARSRFAAQIAAVDAPPPPGVTVEALQASSHAGPIPLRLYLPPGTPAPAPAIVYFHGGGWVIGDLDTHDALCRRLAVAARCRMVAVDYRLAPEHRFPAAVEDAVAAFRWVIAHAGDIGIDAARVAVAGDSAGGNLSAVVALKTRGDAHPPVVQALIYPGTDGTRSQPSHAELREGYILSERMIGWFLDHYVSEGERRHPDFSVLDAEDVRGAAPALVYTAGFDPLRDEGRAYAERLRAVGGLTRYVEFSSLIHGFAQMTGVLPAARLAFDEIAADLGRALHG